MSKNRFCQKYALHVKECRMKTAGHLGALLQRCCMHLTPVPLQLAACSMVGLYAFTFVQHCSSDCGPWHCLRIFTSRDLSSPRSAGVSQMAIYIHSVQAAHIGYLHMGYLHMLFCTLSASCKNSGNMLLFNASLALACTGSVQVPSNWQYCIARRSLRRSA